MTGPQEGPWCAEASSARGEPLTATASRVERWLLVELDTGWGPATVPQALEHLQPVAAAARARLLAIRRPGRTEPVGHCVFSVESRPGLESVVRDHVPDLSDVVFGRGEPYDGPVYLVCTHGRHDRCCALRGRPVAAALAEAHRDAVWECSHIGGERFAANVVVLPEGHYLGRVTPATVVAAVRDLPADLYRGRSSLPSPVQAAQAFAGGTPALVSQEVVGPDTWAVRFEGGVEVVVRYDRAGAPPELLTCDAAVPKVAPAFRLVSLSP